MHLFGRKNDLLAGRYKIEKYLAQGGMGAVFLAFDTRLKCDVAVKKQILNNNEMSIRLFQREAEILANLKHQGLPKVTDYFKLDGNYYLVMDFIKGFDLHHYIENEELLLIEHGSSLLLQLLDILIYLHSYGIVHKDIKPSNLKIENDTDLKLIDFGLVKGNFGKVSKDIEIIGGTPLYMPLEQTECGKNIGIEISETSDVYSAAATFYHLMTGVTPVLSIERFLSVQNGKSDPLIAAHALNGEIPISVSQLLSNALNLYPEKRTSSAFEFKEQLKVALQRDAKRYTKWSSEKMNFVLTSSISNLPHADCIIPVTINSSNSKPEIVLSWIDTTPFANQIAMVEPFNFNIKTAIYETSYGVLVCTLFYVLNPSNPDEMFAGNECYINIYNPEIINPYEILASQSHWHLFILNGEHDTLNVYEFENNFKFGESLDRAKKQANNIRLIDFNKAKQEFMNSFTMDDIFNM